MTEDHQKIINGAYRKNEPNEEIGYQKWRVRKTYEVVMEYEIVAKTKKEAEELFDKKEAIKVEDVDEYGDSFMETITGRHINDLEGDEPTTWEKVEECMPTEDRDIDTDKFFLNYADPCWSKDEFEWQKKEDGTDIEVKDENK